jgi:hypothetical protein
MMTKIWWPLLALKEIVCNLPHFAFKYWPIDIQTAKNEKGGHKSPF